MFDVCRYMLRAYVHCRQTWGSIMKWEVWVWPSKICGRSCETLWLTFYWTTPYPLYGVL